MKERIIRIRGAQSAHDAGVLDRQFRRRGSAPVDETLETGFWANRSATMMVMSCENPDGAIGITDASATASTRTPYTEPAVFTTAPSSGDGPIAHVPTTCGTD